MSIYHLHYLFKIGCVLRFQYKYHPRDSSITWVEIKDTLINRSIFNNIQSLVSDSVNMFINMRNIFMMKHTPSVTAKQVVSNLG